MVEQNSKLMQGKTCLVTGATNGIGRETALGLARLGATVIATGRNAEQGKLLEQEMQSLAGSGQFIAADFSSLQSVRALADNVKKTTGQLQVLVNNAGVWETERKLSADGLELTMAVNHFAPFLLTNLLADLLQNSQPARIVNVSSAFYRRGYLDLNDLQGEKNFSGVRAYANSKLANILFTQELARRLQGQNLTANSLHPGVVSTHLFDQLPAWLFAVARPFMLSPAKGAATSIFLASSPQVNSQSGLYFAKQKPVKLSHRQLSGAEAQQLWQISREITGSKAGF